MTRGAVPIGLLICFALTVVAGCSESTTHGMLHGVVTLDDAPLAEGTVRFVPIDGATQTASAEVRDGAFTAEVPIGAMRVEFSAPKVIGKRKMYDTPESPVVDDVVELLPPRYNVTSELRYESKAGESEERFELVSGA